VVAGVSFSIEVKSVFENDASEFDVAWFFLVLDESEVLVARSIVDEVVTVSGTVSVEIGLVFLADSELVRV
jgi:hypothetical protein